MIVRIMNYEEEEDGGGWRVEKVCRGHNVETADNKIHSSRINTYAHCSPSPCLQIFGLWLVPGMQEEFGRCGYRVSNTKYDMYSVKIEPTVYIYF